MLTIKSPLEMAKRKRQYGLTLSRKDRAQLILFGDEGECREVLTKTQKIRKNSRT